MEQGSDNLRERLLARLPQPANYAAYREGVAAKLSRHEKRLRFDRWATVFVWLFAVAFLLLISVWRGENWMATVHGRAAVFFCIVLFIFGLAQVLGHAISRSHFDLLKEIKQLQLQVLELQASLNRTGENQS